jgi:hypothetical protein
MHAVAGSSGRIHVTPLSREPLCLNKPVLAYQLEGGDSVLVEHVILQ